jgi:chemotaxis protein MotB
MSGKKQHHEEHVDETWLIPYADVLTLLLALFIVMFATAKSDPVKREQLSMEFAVLFSGGAEGGPGAGGKGLLEKDGKTLMPFKPASKVLGDAGDVGDEGEGQKLLIVKGEIEKMLGSGDFDSGEGGIGGHVGDTGIGGGSYKDNIEISLNKDYLEISIRDVVLFNSGKAEILPAIKPLLVSIVSTFKNMDNEIIIGGHTDNVPIRNAEFKSNWELSSARAINVMKFMAASGGVTEKRFSVQAFGEFKPEFDNDTKEGRAKNRRVEIFIIRKDSDKIIDVSPTVHDGQ